MTAGGYGPIRRKPELDRAVGKEEVLRSTPKKPETLPAPGGGMIGKRRLMDGDPRHHAPSGERGREGGWGVWGGGGGEGGREKGKREGEQGRPGDQPPTG